MTVHHSFEKEPSALPVHHAPLCVSFGLFLEVGGFWCPHVCVVALLSCALSSNVRTPRKITCLPLRPLPSIH